MAQLPPKVPSMAQNWPSFPFHQMMPLPSTPSTAAAAAVQLQNSWFDEFFDFSASRRSSHRRTASDPIAFVEECRNSNGTLLMSCNNNNGFFERLDDEQLKSMFSDDVAAPGGSTRSSSNPSSTNPSTSSDQNSDENHEKTQLHEDPREVHVQPKNEPGEVNSSCKPQMEMQVENPNKPPPSNVPSDTIVDPKRIKRILANRQSAQRSRVRKLHYISELERSVTTLQNEVSALSPRVAFLDHQRLLLNVDNSALKQRIAALAQDNIFKDAHQEALKKEIERLRQIFHEQNMKKTFTEDTSTEEPTPTPTPTPTPIPTVNNINYCTDE